jgi:hypothetical protein
MKVQTYFYCNEVRKCKHKTNIMRLWCKIVCQTIVEKIEGNERSYLYLYPFVNLVQRKFYRGFYMPTNQGSFLRCFLTTSELQVN